MPQSTRQEESKNTGQAENAYVLKDAQDAAEAQRLNDQHFFYQSFSLEGTVLHPSIPRQRISAVADVGTGTGIWLTELAKELYEDRSRDGHSGICFDGFDVSLKLCPETHPPNFTYVKQSILDPFPTAYHNKYDVVHARHLLGALKENQVALALDNLLSILKPNGYLQWAENDLTRFRYNDNSLIAERSDTKFFRSQATSYNPRLPHQIAALCRERHLLDLTATEYDSLRTPEMEARTADGARRWQVESKRAFSPHQYLARGEAKTMEEARRMTEELVSEIEEAHDRGAVLGLVLVVVVARKNGNVVR